MIQRTRWRPDTCDCVLVYEWDDSVTSGPQSHTGAVVERACSDHVGTAGDPAQHHRAVHHDNRSKNVFVNAVADSLGWADVGGVEINGQFHPERIPYSYTPQRDLNTTVAALQLLGASAGAAGQARAAGLAAVANFRAAHPLGNGGAAIAAVGK